MYSCLKIEFSWFQFAGWFSFYVVRIYLVDSKRRETLNKILNLATFLSLYLSGEVIKYACLVGNCIFVSRLLSLWVCVLLSFVSFDQALHRLSCFETNVANGRRYHHYHRTYYSRVLNDLASGFEINNFRYIEYHCCLINWWEITPAKAEARRNNANDSVYSGFNVVFLLLSTVYKLSEAVHTIYLMKCIEALIFLCY